MPAFEFKALTASGRARSGVLEGDTARGVRQQLRAQGLTPVEVRPLGEERAAGAGRPARARGGLTASELALVTRQLATLVRSGTPLEEALATVARQSEKARIKKILMAVRARVNEGYTLEAALAQFPSAFPELYRATVAAGEKSGHLDAVLDRLAEYAEARQEMRQKVSMALFYPATLTLIAILVVVGLLTYVVPQVVQVFEHMDQELPWLTRTLIATSDFLKANGIYLLAALAAGGFVFSRALRNEAFRYRVHGLVLRLPLVGKITRGVNTARFARTLSILTASGVPVLEALRISAEVMPNLPMRKAVLAASDNVREGSTIRAALEQSGYFPPMTIHLIASGEASGELEAMLERAAVHQERELQTLIGALMSLFEPILILVMGGVVLVIVIAILLPIFELNQMVQ